MLLAMACKAASAVVQHALVIINISRWNSQSTHWQITLKRANGPPRPPTSQRQSPTLPSCVPQHGRIRIHLLKILVV